MRASGEFDGGERSHWVFTYPRPRFICHPAFKNLKKKHKCHLLNKNGNIYININPLI